MANSKLFETVGGFEGRLPIEGHMCQTKQKKLDSKTVRMSAVRQ
jgi:hypothetical protein